MKSPKEPWYFWDWVTILIAMPFAFPFWFFFFPAILCLWIMDRIAKFNVNISIAGFNLRKE